MNNGWCILKKLFYIGCINKNEQIGVLNKINSQCNEFAKHYETVLIYPEGDNVLIKNFNNMELKKNENVLSIKKNMSNSIIDKISNRIRVVKFNLCLKKLLLKEKPEIIYVRRYEILNGIRILRKYKKISNAYIIYEIPTYPYEQEYTNNGKHFLKILNRLLDKGMESISNLIPVVLGKEVKFNSSKYFPIFNGIDIKDIHIKNKNIYKENRIDLVGVANVSFWHGYDRIIEGLKNYYNMDKKEIVVFNIVGEGDELNNLKELVIKYKLNDYVVFHGIKKGEELEKIIEFCEIGVGSLGMHRSELTCGSTLKAREYCARGIPFILGYKDYGFSEEFKYIYKIQPNEAPINIDDVISFYNSIKNENYVDEMREYAENNLTWGATMKPIINEINKN